MSEQGSHQDPWSHVPADLRVRYDESCVSIPNAVRVAARRFGDLEALVDGDLRLSFADLERHMLDSVRAVSALGIHPTAGCTPVTSACWTGVASCASPTGFKDMVIVGGFNVYPAEVERVLAEHPAVSAVAVVGMPDARLGEVPVAFVVPRPGTDPDPEQVISWTRERLANFKVPRRVERVEALPRNASMKVLKNELRAAARALR